MTQEELNKIFDKFLSENNNKYIERVDSDSLNQCFDLAIYWCEYLGFPKNIFSGLLSAREIYENWSHPQFEKISNTPDYIPQKGDIVVWSGDKPYTGGAGHVGVATGTGDTNTFQCFEQNDPSYTVSHVKTYNYDYVLGAQRLKISTVGTTPSPDRRPYWFDRVNSVVWNKPHEQLTDTEIESFVSAYPFQLKRSGLWDQLCIKAGLTGDSNMVTVNQLFEKIQELKICPPGSSSSQCENTLQEIKSVLKNKGFWWIKLNKIKSLLA